MKPLAVSLIVACCCLPLFSSAALAQQAHWASQVIAFVQDKGILKGPLSNPDAQITYGEFAAAVGQLSGQTVGALTDSGIVPAAFSPDQCITRAAMAEIVYNYALAAGKNVAAKAAAKPFTDLSSVAEPAKTAIVALQQAGVIDGKAPGVFDPLGQGTYAEAAALLAGVYALEGGQQVVAMISSNWWDALPRASWSQFEPVDVGDDWFSVYKLPGDVYAIYEDGQWQEVISFLVIGREKAMLWDTGMGIGDIRACAEKLTTLPIFVVNSHTHGDHVGGNWQFEETYVFNHPAAVEKLIAGSPHEKVMSELAEGSVWKELPAYFDPETYVLKGKAPTGVLNEGDIIDLGGRRLEVIHTPGHSADSIMLIDEANKIIFTGDTYYPAPLYAFSKDLGLDVYVSSMKKVAAKVKDLNLEWIYSSHNELVKGTEILGKVADCLEQIYTGQKTDYVKNDRGLRLFQFDGGAVKILTLDQDYGK